MLNFVQNFAYYMTFEVIEPHWRQFQASLSTVENIDQVLALHMEMLESCMKDCMLINQELLKIVTKLMMVCITFSNFIQVNIREKQKDWKLPAKNGTNNFAIKMHVQNLNLYFFVSSASVKVRVWRCRVYMQLHHSRP